MPERLQKVLAAAGVASRRAAEELIARGEVTVNGEVAQLGQQVDLQLDGIAVRGKPIASSLPVYLALNKPVGLVSSLRSTHGERTVRELVDLPERVFPVGRLDKDTSGLIFMTNDGDWANLVTHPRHALEKEYWAWVAGIPRSAELQRLREGVRLAGGVVTAPARVEVVETRAGRSRVRLIVGEGRKRQIRLMLAAVGHPVASLERVRIGPVRLEGLAPGKWRRLSRDEVEAVRGAARAVRA